MRGVVPFSPARADWPKCRGFEAKGLKGFEPSTFCMAIRPVSETGQRQRWGLAGVS